MYGSSKHTETKTKPLYIHKEFHVHKKTDSIFNRKVQSANKFQPISHPRDHDIVAIDTRDGTRI